MQAEGLFDLPDAVCGMALRTTSASVGQETQQVTICVFSLYALRPMPFQIGIQSRA